MKESNLFRSLVATFVVIVLGGPAVVLADTISYLEVGKASVSYADLNLESEEDVRVLYRRLKRASSNVCGATTRKRRGQSTLKIQLSMNMIEGHQISGPVPIIFQLGNSLETGRCYRQTLSDAVDEFDNENLTRIHAG